MPIEGTDLPVWGMEIDADEARRRFKTSSSDGKTSKVRALCHIFDLHVFLGSDFIMQCPFKTEI